MNFNAIIISTFTSVTAYVFTFPLYPALSLLCETFPLLPACKAAYSPPPRCVSEYSTKTHTVKHFIIVFHFITAQKQFSGNPEHNYVSYCSYAVILHVYEEFPEHYHYCRKVKISRWVCMIH
jgi:hypothetical protein